MNDKIIGDSDNPIPEVKLSQGDLLATAFGFKTGEGTRIVL